MFFELFALVLLSPQCKLSVQWRSFVRIGFSLVAQPASYSVVTPNGGQRVHALPYPNGFYRIILRGNETNNRFTIIEGLVYRDEGARTHYHMAEDESFFVLNGSLQFSVAGREFCAQAGTTVFIPRNVTQSVRNVNDQPVHVQILFSPSGREFFLEKISVLNDNPPVNASQAAALLADYGQVNLPVVNWTDIGCYPSNSSVLSRLSTSSLLLLLLLFFLLLLFRGE